jgi:hypothetical protein
VNAQYLRVRNFEQYQHYKNRRPVWIKSHISMLDDYEINRLDYPTRLLVHQLLLVAATHDNNIPYDPAYIAGKVSMDESTVAECVAKLIAERFLLLSKRKHSASKVLAQRSATASPEKKREEKEKPKGLFVPSTDTAPIRQLIDKSLKGANAA